MARSPDSEANRLDDAARAGWLYYIGGNTQDEVAAKLGVSRQTAQRLVSLAVSAKLIKVRLDHPIAHCLDLSSRLIERFGLRFCEIVPADPTSPSTILGVAEAAAAELERQLSSQLPIIVAMGTGRTLKAVVAHLPPMDCPQHKIVSLVGNIAPDGSASFYDIIMRIADTVRAPHYPMPIPVIAGTLHEKELFLSQKPVRNVIELAKQANVAIVGIGQLGEGAPLLQDGFVTADEMRKLLKAGAVGEIVGWAYDATGNLIPGLTNDRVASIRPSQSVRQTVIGVAMGEAKTTALVGALRGRLINGLITNETMAEVLLRK
jgi:DNA-binding transcriptional regulator LsrR (DeoR family)